MVFSRCVGIDESCAAIGTFPPFPQPGASREIFGVVFCRVDRSSAVLSVTGTARALSWHGAVAQCAVETIVTELVLKRDEWAGPQQKVNVLAAVLEDQAQDLVWQVQQVTGSMRD